MFKLIRETVPLLWHIKSFQLNQIALPSNLEPNAPSNQSPRYFTASEVFTVLYGQTTRWQVNKDELGSQSAGRFVAQEALNPGNFCKHLLQRFLYGKCFA